MKNCSLTILLCLALLLHLGCNSGAGTSETAAKSDEPSHTLQGVGGEDGTCAVDPTLVPTENRHWPGFEKGKYFELHLDNPTLRPTITPTSTSLVYRYGFGDCHGDTLGCADVTPACTCRFTYDDGGAQVIEISFSNEGDRKAVQLGGILIAVLDDGGGGGPH